MKNRTYILLLCAVFLLCGCASKKHTVKPTEQQPDQTTPTWHTAQAANTQLTLDVDMQRYSVMCQIQAVRDSMIVISVMPMLNMELLRLEFTPDTAIVIDKINRRYTKLALDAAQDEVVPAIKWKDLQNFATGTGFNSLGYSFREHTVRLTASYGEIVYDAPVNVRHQRLERYQFVDINTILK